MYVIYWPEDTTWDDSAIGSVRKNRVTFIRYLTRLADQIRVLIGPEQATSLVWKEDNQIEEDEDDFGFEFELPATDEDDAGGDRVFQFEVKETNEQEEDAKVGPGYTVSQQNLFALRAMSANDRRNVVGTSRARPFEP